MADDEMALERLADGVIPADGRDAGGGSSGVGRRLMERMSTNGLLLEGLALGHTLARELHGRPIVELDGRQVESLLATLRERAPAFFKQLRMDVCAFYLADPAVARAIGFPGPSTDAGGYPDFDAPQG